MFTAKDILIKLIDAKSANAVCKLYHYSGKSTPNSQLHFGVFLGDRIEGVLQFGPSIDKRRMARNLGVGFNEILELNRLAFSDALPKNSESRAISYCIKMISKKYPHIRLILSFADACQCGDGAIYRASGFKLHSYKKNASLLQLSPDALAIVKKHIPTASAVIADKTLNNIMIAKGKTLTSVAKKAGARPLVGFQMKYLYCIDKRLENRFRWIPFRDIPDSARMYKGTRVTSIDSDATVNPDGKGLCNSDRDAPKTKTAPV